MYLLFLSEREKRNRKKTSSKFLADIDVGLSCAEFISAHLCPACGYCVNNLESNEKAYTFTAMFGRCVDPLESHYVAQLELKCKKCKAIRTILKHVPDEGVRVTLRN
jgi:phage FluMu protein Com